MADTRTTENPEPRTEAGKRLLEQEAFNSRSFPLITIEAIREIEREAAWMATSRQAALHDCSEALAIAAEAAQGAAPLDPLVWLRKVRERLTAKARSVDYHIAMLCVENTEAEYRQARSEGAAPRAEGLSVEALAEASMLAAGSQRIDGRIPALHIERAEAILHHLGAAPRAEGLDEKDIEADIEYVREALKIGAISYDGDSWYAASDEGGAGLGYDHCEAAMKQGFAALNRLAARLSPQERRDE